MKPSKLIKVYVYADPFGDTHTIRVYASGDVYMVNAQGVLEALSNVAFMAPDKEGRDAQEAKVAQAAREGRQALESYTKLKWKPVKV